MSLVNVTRFQLPNGQKYTLAGEYTGGDTAGVTALSVAAGISCISTGTLLILLVLSANRRFQAPGQVVFIRTHVAPYFLSLLFCDFWQSIGSLLSVHWVSNGRVFLGSTCTAQAAIKNGGNVGTAIWSLAIGLHTFFVLFVGRRPWEPALYFTLILCWCLIGFIVIIGPVAIEDLATRGPYFGVSGLWCWITEQYSLPQLMLEYLWLFSSAGINVVLYLLIWLKLRGNLVINGWSWRLRRAQGKTWDPTTGQTSLQAQVTSITQHMMMFPIVYFLVVMPIAGCRYAIWADYDVPFQLIIFADVIFILQGFINVVLFCCTRSVIPADHQNLFGVSTVSGGSTHSRVKRIPSTDDEESSMSMEPVTMQFEPQPKPQRIQRVDHIISIEPPRAISPAPSRPSGSRQHSRAGSFGNVYEGQRSGYHPDDENPAQWVSYSSVPSSSASPRLTAQELGRINAHYIPSRTPPPQQLAVQRAAPLPGSSRAVPARPRTPLRVINATETIVSMVDVDLHDEPEEMPHTARPFMYGHSRAASSSASSVSSYMTDDSNAPLTATPARSKDSHARRESGLAFERYSDHRSHSPGPMPPLHPYAPGHSRSASYSSTYEHHMPPPIATSYAASSSGSITQSQMMGLPMVTVQAASPMSPPRTVPEPISLGAARRAPPSNVPNTARPPTPLSRNSHGSGDSHAAGAGGSIYL